MELPLSYSFSKLNKVTLTNIKNSSILHVCGELQLSSLSEIQDLFLSDVQRKNYTEDEFQNLLTELYTENKQDYDIEEFNNLNLEDIASSISPSEDLLDDKNEGPIIKLINAKPIIDRETYPPIAPADSRLSTKKYQRLKSIFI